MSDPAGGGGKSPHFNFAYDPAWETRRGNGRLTDARIPLTSVMMEDAPGGVSWRAISHNGPGVPDTRHIPQQRDFKVRVRLSVLPKRLRFHLLRFGAGDGDSFLYSKNESGKFGVDANGLRFIFSVNDSSRLSSIETTVQADNHLYANNYALSSLNSCLSMLAYYHNVPLQYDAISICDTLTGVEYLPYTTSYKVQELGGNTLGVSQFLSPLFALYREAIASHSFPYRFFCFGKIMEGAFGSINKAISDRAKEIGINVKRRRVLVPNSIYIHSAYRSYIGKPVRAFYEKEVQSTRKRDLFAHFSLELRLRQDFDNPSYHHDMGNLAFVCDLCARDLISEIYDASLQLIQLDE